jgi:hypothetical protein
VALVACADGVAARVGGQFLEHAEVNRHLQAECAGLAIAAFQDSCLQLLEIGSLHQRLELLEQLFQPLPAPFGRERLDRHGHRVGVERGVVIFQLLQTLVVFKVKDRRDQHTQLAEGIPIAAR